MGSVTTDAILQYEQGLGAPTSSGETVVIIPSVNEIPGAGPALAHLPLDVVLRQTRLNALPCHIHTQPIT